MSSGRVLTKKKSRINILELLPIEILLNEIISLLTLQDCLSFARTSKKNAKGVGPLLQVTTAGQLNSLIINLSRAQSNYHYFSANPSAAFLDSALTRERFLFSIVGQSHVGWAVGIVVSAAIGALFWPLGLTIAASIGGALMTLATIHKGYCIYDDHIRPLIVFHSPWAYKFSINREKTQFEKAVGRGEIQDVLTLARTQLESWAENNSKRNLWARIKLYDNKTQIALIKEILADKEKKTILGKRFWRKEGLFDCHPYAGTLCEMNIRLLEFKKHESPSPSRTPSRMPPRLNAFSMGRR